MYAQYLSKTINKKLLRWKWHKCIELLSMDALAFVIRLYVVFAVSQNCAVS